MLLLNFMVTFKRCSKLSSSTPRCRIRTDSLKWHSALSALSVYVNLLVTLKNGESKSENTSTSQVDFTLMVSCCFGSCLCGRDKMGSKVSTTTKMAVVLLQNKCRCAILKALNTVIAVLPFNNTLSVYFSMELS